jgi:hypothetical protein
MSEYAYSTGDVILEKESQVLGVKSVPVPLCPPQIPHGQASDGDASGQPPNTSNGHSFYLNTV